MILVFVILGIIILINLIILIISLSNIKIKLNELYISNINKNLNIKYEIELGVYFINKIKIFRILLNNEKIENLIKKGKINIEKIRPNKKLNKKIIQIIKHGNYEIEKLKLEGYYATINTILSGIIYSLENAIIPILISNKSRANSYFNNIKFLNINENIININVTCIISLKIVNITNILYLLKKERRRSKKWKIIQ